MWLLQVRPARLDYVERKLIEQLYVVQPGDTLSGISARFGHHWQDVYDHVSNQRFRELRPDPNLIQPGDIVAIPRGS